MPLEYSIFRYFCSKNRTSRNSIILSTFFYLFHKEMIIIVFNVALPTSLLFGVNTTFVMYTNIATLVSLVRS